MSLFNKDIIKKDIECLPDPHENMCYQIERYFMRICEYYYYYSHGTYPHNIREILYNDLKIAFDEIYFMIEPSWWKGERLHIAEWQIQHPSPNDINKFTLYWRYTNDINIYKLELLIPHIEDEHIQ